MTNESIIPIVCKGCKIPKGWGEEIIIENNQLSYGLKPADLKEYLSIALVTNHEIITDVYSSGEIIYEYSEDYIKNNKNKTESFSLDNYIIM